MAASRSKNRLSQIMRQGNPVPMFTSVASWVDVVSLTANTPKSYTIPTGCHFLRFTPDVIPCYGMVNGTAAVPGSDVTDGSASFPVGAQSYIAIDSGDTAVSLICASDCHVSIEVWD